MLFVYLTLPQDVLPKNMETGTTMESDVRLSTADCQTDVMPTVSRDTGTDALDVRDQGGLRLSLESVAINALKHYLAQ